MDLSSNLKTAGGLHTDLVLRKTGQRDEQLRIMMKITMDAGHQPPVLKIEGNLTGPWVSEAEGAWAKLNDGGKNGHVIVDLTGVTFVDERGKNLLAGMFQRGAELRAAFGLTRYIVEKIQQSGTNSEK
jgi:anti-anti-sigma regulatory factor